MQIFAYFWRRNLTNFKFDWIVLRTCPQNLLNWSLHFCRKFPFSEVLAQGWVLFIDYLFSISLPNFLSNLSKQTSDPTKIFSGKYSPHDMVNQWNVVTIFFIWKMRTKSRPLYHKMIIQSIPKEILQCHQNRQKMLPNCKRNIQYELLCLDFSIPNITLN